MPTPPPASVSDRERMRAIERGGTLKYFAREEPGEPRAGAATEALSRSNTALDYKSTKLEPGRTFMMDDYAAIGRAARRPAPSLDSVATLIAYQPTAEVVADSSTGSTGSGGLCATKFGTGFTRRQQRDIGQDEERKRWEEHKRATTSPAEQRRERLLEVTQTRHLFAGEGGSGPTQAPRVEPRPGSVGDNSHVSRLRSSTSRFHCTAEELSPSESRRGKLLAEGLTTKRTSAVIGIGAGPRIESVGVRENFTESHYAQQRRRDDAEIEMVRKLV